MPLMIADWYDLSEEERRLVLSLPVSLILLGAKLLLVFHT